MTVIDRDERRAWLALGRAPGLGGVIAQKLTESFGSLAAARGAAEGSLEKAGLPDRAARRAFLRPDEDLIAADEAWLDAAENRHLLWLGGPGYPARLASIAAPPALLWVRGDVATLETPQVGIVGARHATQGGLENARAFARDLVKNGLTVTSGLAQGIDGAAHQGALDGQGQTVAVCATGLDRVYPNAHRGLAQEIMARGALVSEFPPGVQARPEFFPRRNRLISGLSLGVLVVEAARDSGSLITATYATEQGREVFAIPGSIHNPQSRGCHYLIRQGAKLVESTADILVELSAVLRGWLETHPALAAEEGGVAPDASADANDPLLVALGYDPVDTDTLATRLGWPADRLQAELLRLELDGRLETLLDGRLQRRARPT